VRDKHASSAIDKSDEDGGRSRIRTATAASFRLL
jgi:hypothetical protein